VDAMVVASLRMTRASSADVIRRHGLRMAQVVNQMPSVVPNYSFCFLQQHHHPIGLIWIHLLSCDWVTWNASTKTEKQFGLLSLLTGWHKCRISDRV